MTAREYLSQPYLLDKRIRSKERQLEALKSITSCVSPSYGEEHSLGAKAGSPVEYAALRIVTLSDEIEEDRKTLARMLEEVASVINRLGSTGHIELMTMRYVMFLPWEEIVERMGYTRSYIFRMHREALDCIHP